ncbi:MAG TPA: glycosyltransferase family 1 protein [Ardenticatenaceae bacterium]
MNPTTILLDAEQEEEQTSPQAFNHDLVCFSHLRWDFVLQRPQHLLSRAARERRVFYIEEPQWHETGTPRLERYERDGVRVVTPHLPWMSNGEEARRVRRELIDELWEEEQIGRPVLWYYTPLDLSFTDHLEAAAVIYDCMDELSLFKGAPPYLKDLEQELFRRADLVFTGGQSLYEAKRSQHPEVHAFPSSIEAEHFAQARAPQADPADQAEIPHPRLGFYGVIDERFDLELLEGMADLRPEWQFVIVGPVVKIEEHVLPRRPNIHYLGSKQYRELPAYLAGWDVATLLFARNDSTRFISPTKTPEYLAGGKPVVSTSIRDVARPYGELGLVRIADTPEAFVKAAEAAMREDNAESGWLERVDDFLSRNSWDRTWAQMAQLITAVANHAAADEQAA